MSSAWIYQDPKQLKKHGPEAASWYVGWIDRTASSGASPRPGGERTEESRRTSIILENHLGTRKVRSRQQQEMGRLPQEFETRIVAAKAPARPVTAEALDVFQRIAKPKKLATIRTQTIDEFIAKRRLEKASARATAFPQRQSIGSSGI